VALQITVGAATEARFTLRGRSARPFRRRLRWFHLLRADVRAMLNARSPCAQLHLPDRRTPQHAHGV